MALEVQGITIFRGDSGLCLRVVSDRDADGSKELSNVVYSLRDFYSTVIGKHSLDSKPKPVEDASGPAFLYTLRRKNKEDETKKEHAGTIKIVQKGMTPKTDLRKGDDYAIADPTRYIESYFLFFFTEDKSIRGRHRDAYAVFLDPSMKKTRHQK